MIDPLTGVVNLVPRYVGRDNKLIFMPVLYDFCT
jgi:hypothetical protein